MALTCAHLQRPKTPTSPPPHLHPPSLPSPHIRRRHLRALDQRRRRRGFGRQLVGRPTSIHARVRAILVEATLGTAAEREKPRPRRPRRAALQAAARARELTRAASRRDGLTARRRRGRRRSRLGPIRRWHGRMCHRWRAFGFVSYQLRFWNLIHGHALRLGKDFSERLRKPLVTKGCKITQGHPS